jgi:hypothetical protein
VIIAPQKETLTRYRLIVGVKISSPVPEYNKFSTEDQIIAPNKVMLNILPFDFPAKIKHNKAMLIDIMIILRRAYDIIFCFILKFN